jgi:transposase
VASGKKNARKQKAVIVFTDESGLSQRPPIHRTWAPKGQTPVLTHSYSWEQLSMNAALVYRWDGKPLNLFFEIIPGTYNQFRLVDFLDSLRRELKNRRMILIWDGLPAHKTVIVQEYLANYEKIQVVQLPAYAPDHNPTEFLWANLKRCELANYVPDGLDELCKQACTGIRRAYKSETLLGGFARAAKLFF